MDPSAAESVITKGSILRIYNGEHIDMPVLQCVQIKKLNSGNPELPRYRVVWSDVHNFIQSILASQLNPILESGSLAKNKLCRLKNYQAQEVKGKAVIVVLDCEVLEEYGEPQKIGEPLGLDGVPPKSASAGAEQHQMVARQPAQQSAQPSAIPSNGFYGQKVEPKMESQQSYRPPSSSQHAHILPIEAVSPYAHKWTIKARCTHKSDIKTWHNTKGEGKLFSVNFLDESGEIRATGFNDQCDAFYDIFQEDSVYYISTPCRVGLAKKQFSNVNNDYELTFERETVVEKAPPEDQKNAPKVRYNFTPISAIADVSKDTTTDVIGVLHDVQPVSEIVSKTTAKPYQKRDLTLVDNTNFSIRLTIWGATATSFDVPTDSVIAFKGCKVSDFNGRSLSLLSSGSMAVDPDIDEAYKLKGWYEAQGRTEASSFQTHAAAAGVADSTGGGKPYITVQEIVETQLGVNTETADWFTLKATVMFISRDNMYYPACHSEGCNKKVVKVSETEWRCERCDRGFERPQYRYIMSVKVSDYTGSLWLSCFDDVSRLVLGGTTADTLEELKENDEIEYNARLNDAQRHTYVFRCRAKTDTFKEQTRLRYQVHTAAPVSFANECRRLAEEIKKFSVAEEGLFIQ